MDKMEFLKPIVAQLKIVEGGYLHRNKGELDITNAYGIYRYAHPTAKVFTYIDTVAKELGINKPSSEWTSEEINSISSKLDVDTELELSTEFYMDYFGKVDITKLPGELAYAYANIYVNSPKIANSCLQDSTNNMLDYFDLKDNFTKIAVDGKVGPGTLKLVEEVKSLDLGRELKRSWVLLFLTKAQTEYIKIATDEVSKSGTDKHLRFLRGWDNRVRAILDLLMKS